MERKRKQKPLNRATAQQTKLRRCREFLGFLFRKFEVKCFDCGEAIDPREFNKHRDDVTILHVDGDGTNNDIDNLEICHRLCYCKRTAPARRKKMEAVNAGASNDSAMVA